MWTNFHQKYIMYIDPGRMMLQRLQHTSVGIAYVEKTSIISLQKTGKPEFTSN